MAKIIDLDNLALTLGVQTSEEVVISTAARTIELTSSGTSNLDDDGVTGQCLYSFLKQQWKLNSTLARYPFPLVSVTEESFEIVDGWSWKDLTTINYLRDCGFAVKNLSGNLTEMYMGLVSLGTFVDPSDQPYYQQVEGAAPTDFHIPGEINECIKIWGDASHGDFDYRDYLKVFIREQGKTYKSYDLTTEQTISQLSYRLYKVPLDNANDIKVNTSDATISTTAPYTGIYITWYASPQAKTIGTGVYNFDIIVEGNSATLEQIYEKVQYELRQTSDIDAGSGVERGDITDSLLSFTGSDLYCSAGVYINNFLAVDTNRLYPKDVTNTVRGYPYVSAGTISLNSNLVADAEAVYWLYFANDDAGSNLGRDYGTDTAIIIEDASDVPISGLVAGRSSIAFDYDFDGNIQRGPGSNTQLVPYVAVAMGLSTGKFCSTSGVLTRSTANVISLSAELERAYNNP